MNIPSVFTGYRGYDQKGIEPLFPFGFGLSYTTFDYSGLNIRMTDKKQKQLVVSFTVTNTGQRDGYEVAQLYVRDMQSKEPRPLKELKGFDKVYLKAGESKQIEIGLSEDAFQYFNAKQNRWVFEKGEFEILVGASSKDIRLAEKIKM